MKRILLILFVSSFISCVKNEKPKLNVYNLEIQSDGIMNNGSIGIKTTSDTIIASDDLSAFKEALITAISTQETSSRLLKGKVYMFSLSDSAGVNIGSSLDILKADSIINSLEEIRPGIAKNVGSKFFYGFQ